MTSNWIHLTITTSTTGTANRSRVTYATPTRHRLKFRFPNRLPNPPKVGVRAPERDFHGVKVHGILCETASKQLPPGCFSDGILRRNSSRARLRDAKSARKLPIGG